MGGDEWVLDSAGSQRGGVEVLDLYAYFLIVFTCTFVLFVQ